MSCPRTGVITHVLKGHTSTVKCVAWDPHHKSILASGGRDGSICIWDLRLSTMSTRPNGDEIRSLQPSITITSAHEDSTPKAPRARTKNIVTPRTVTDVFFSDLNPSQLISSGSFDGSVSLSIKRANLFIPLPSQSPAVLGSPHTTFETRKNPEATSTTHVILVFS